MTIGMLFKERPQQWGLRGDPFLWADMESYFSGLPAPTSEAEFAAALENSFEKLVGSPVSGRGDVYVERYSHGDMSTGMVCLDFWQTKGFPELLSRYRKMFPPVSGPQDSLKLEHIQEGSLVFGVEPEYLVRVLSADQLGNDALNVVYRTTEGRTGERVLFRTDEASLVLAVTSECIAFSYRSDTTKGTLISVVPQESRPASMSKEEWTWRIALSAALTKAPELSLASIKDVAFVVPTSVCEQFKFADHLRTKQQFKGTFSEASVFYLIDSPIDDLTDYPFESPLEGILAIAVALQQGRTLLVLGSYTTSAFLEAVLRRLEHPGEALVKIIWGVELSAFQLGCLYGIGSDAFGKLQQLKRIFSWDLKHGSHDYEA